ncbi:NADPH-dependent 3-demethoxyubiquinone 3-hydroxylase, mitochondrial [Cariama cristata]
MAAGLAPPPGAASGRPAPRVTVPARLGQGLSGGRARLTFVSPAGLWGRWPLPAGGVSLRLCSSRVTLEGINKPVIDRIIRVDHAGEYGANRIYAGQMAILGRSSVGPIIQQMWNQEKDHLKKFNELMVAYRVRPTVLLPFWNVAGFVLGAGSALLGKKGAMACTVAVEESISDHYNSQIRTLMEEDPEKYKELLQIIKQFRDDEREHHDIGLEHDAEAAPAYSVLKTAIQLGCKAAIFLSERI